MKLRSFKMVAERLVLSHLPLAELLAKWRAIRNFANVQRAMPCEYCCSPCSCFCYMQLTVAEFYCGEPLSVSDA